MDVDRMQQVVISQLRALAAEAAAKSQAGEGIAGAPSTQQSDFAATLQSALHVVNRQMQQADKLQQQFSAGRSDLSLSDVMLAGQKASLSFQAVLQVRNKLVSAYQDIMNIQA